VPIGSVLRRGARKVFGAVAMYWLRTPAGCGGTTNGAGLDTATRRGAYLLPNGTRVFSGRRVGGQSRCRRVAAGSAAARSSWPTRRSPSWVCSVGQWASRA